MQHDTLMPTQTLAGLLLLRRRRRATAVMNVSYDHVLCTLALMTLQEDPWRSGDLLVAVLAGGLRLTVEKVICNLRAAVSSVMNQHRQATRDAHASALARRGG